MVAALARLRGILRGGTAAGIAVGRTLRRPRGGGGSAPTIVVTPLTWLETDGPLLAAVYIANPEPGAEYEVELVDDPYELFTFDGNNLETPTGLDYETVPNPWFSMRFRRTNPLGDWYPTQTFYPNVGNVIELPDAFEVGDWDADAGDEQIDITINSLPADNGAAITDIEYRIDGGSWVSSGGTTSFTISGLTNGVEYDVELRARNADGVSDASDLKSVTPFDPLNLSTKLRAWWDFTDAAALFQNSGGTGAVGSAAEPVGYATDKSTNGKHLTQATSGARPLFQVSPSRVRFDGSNDFLALASAAFPIDAFEIFIVFEEHATSNDTRGIVEFGPSTGSVSSSGAALCILTGPNTDWAGAYGIAGTLSAWAAGTGAAPKAVYELVKAVSTSALNINGSNIANDNSFTVATTPHSGTFRVGALSNSNIAQQFAAIDVYEIILTAALTSDERNNVRAYLYNKHSITP